MTVTAIPRDAIKSIFTSMLPSTVVVLWDGDPVPFPGSGLTCTISVNGVAAVGVDETRENLPNPASQAGLRTFVLTVDMVDLSGANVAYDQLEYIRTRMRRPSIRQILRNNGLSIDKFMPLIDLDDVGDTRTISHSTMDIKMNLAVNDVDTTDTADYFTEVDGGGPIPGAFTP